MSDWCDNHFGWLLSYNVIGGLSIMGFGGLLIINKPLYAKAQVEDVLLYTDRFTDHTLSTKLKYQGLQTCVILQIMCCFAQFLMYVINADMCSQFGIFYAMNCVYWTIAGMVLHYEFKTLKAITNYLRQMWLVQLFVYCTCFGLMIFDQYQHSHSLKEQLEIHLFLIVISMVVNGIGCLMPSKNRKQDVASLVINHYNASESIGDDLFHKRSTMKGSQKLPSFIERMESQANTYQNSLNDVSQHVSSAQHQILSYDNSSNVVYETCRTDYHILWVQIVGFGEQTKFGKRTLLFKVIGKLSNGDEFSCKRSYREFLTLYKGMEKQYPTIELPEFPRKGKSSEFITYQILQERKQSFEDMLNFFVDNNMICQTFLIFMNIDFESRDSKILKSLINILEQPSGSFSLIDENQFDQLLRSGRRKSSSSIQDQE